MGACATWNILADRNEIWKQHSIADRLGCCGIFPLIEIKLFYSERQMTIRIAISTIAACAAVLGAIGTAVGWLLGTFSPGYYRSVFRGGDEPWFDPVSVGVAQGLTQGISGGIFVGLLLVVIFVWREKRASTLQ